MSRLFVRAALAVAALPGLVAVAAPLLWLRSQHASPVFWPGALVLALGLWGLLDCVRGFYVAGRGTLAPWSPPRRLVVEGLYRWSRNPMYIAVLSMLVGWAALFASWALALYAAAVAIAFHLRVVLGEEPALAQRFGAEWEAYRARVPRWWRP